jgi:hypothetical protein
MGVFKTSTFVPLSNAAMESIDMGMLDLGDHGFGLAEAMIPVQEGYVGKTKNIAKIEHLFGVMQQKYPTRDIFERSRKDLEDCPEKREIESLICKEFGFRSACLGVSVIKMVNGITVPRSVLIRDATTGMPRGLTLHGEKWYDSAHQYDFFCLMFTENFQKLTPGELTALLLHEIGHCFDITTMTFIADVFNWLCCVATGPISIFTNYFRTNIAKYLYKFVDLLENITPISILVNAGLTVNDLLVMIAGPYGSLSYMGRMLVGGLVNLITEPGTTIMKALSGIGKEKFADSFATAYGYGPELISLMDKLDTYYITTNKTVIVDTWTWAGSIAPTIMNLLMSTHPDAQTRARMALDDLRKLSENPNLPKHIRASVKKDYENAKEAYALFLQVEPDTRDAIALRFSRNLKENILSGKMDLRTYFYTTSAIQDGIRSAYR